MFRTATEDLINWKNSKNKRALLVTGARQIGKTYLIRQFAREHYKNFIELNFLEDPKAREIFDGNLDAQTILMLISAYTTTPFEKGNTLFFFDEIQECPNARTAIKFLVEDGRYDYIESGSLLGVNYKVVPSYPVGYETILHMYPMTFKEFCLANKLSSQTFEYLEQCFERKTKVHEAIHQKLLELFRYYTVVGGMPKAVKSFIENKDINKVKQAQNDILELYLQDIQKYALIGKNKITNIFKQIPASLNDKNRKFKLSSINKNVKMRDYEDSFTWLEDAGVALPCFSVSEPVLPLKVNLQTRNFKLYSSDNGLLCNQSLDNAQFQILTGNLSVNLGSILENVFATNLKANQFNLYYFNKQKIGEVDFVVQQGAQIIAVEIKSGNDYHRHAALNNLLSVSEWKISEGIVFCKGNIEVVDKITYYPWYMVMFFKDHLPNFKIDLDLEEINNLIPPKK
ncbi:MAG: AAA family ATPase [Succinivibrio sp.]|nr:AAA family ATPase [Succinivibrio sp.]